MRDLVVGVDAGATTTRCLLVSVTGEVVGRGTAPGANIRSSAGAPAGRFAEALSAAVRGVDPARVRAGVFGVAGGGSAGAQQVGAAVEAAWRSCGLSGPVRQVTDLEVAFAAGTAEPYGALLLAGTGAGAVRFADRRIAQRCDGYGWILGDDGSAVWLGLRGVRAALDAVDGRGPATRLSDDLASQLAVSAADLPQALIARVHADAPARLGALAPLVTRAATDGDEVAAGLVESGADRLIAALRAVAGSAQPGVVVLAGALLADGPVRAAVLRRLDASTAARVRDAGPGAAGAAALALADLADATLDPELHAAVVRAAATDVVRSG